MNLARDLERRAHESSGQVALIVEDGRSWTWAEVDAEASRMAGALERSGVHRGSRVGLYLGNGSELVFLLYGAWKLGAVPVTYSALYDAGELRRSVARTGPQLLITDQDHQDAGTAVHDSVAELIVLDLPGSPFAAARAAAAPNRRGMEMSPEEDGMILFTGGSTGDPKAAAVGHIAKYQAALALARASKGRPAPYATAPPEVAPNLIVMPLFHGGGQQSLIFAFLVGRAVLLMERFRVDAVVRAIEAHRIDNLFLMPTMLYDLAHYRGDADLSSVRSVLVAGQALSPSVRAAFERRYRIPILSNYGATEMGHVAGWTAADIREGRWVPGSVGRVYDGVTLEIRDADGRPVPVGEVGEICVRTSMTRGYVDDPDETGVLLRDGWVHSGDSGYVDAGNVLFVVGRQRDMIKVGGFQVWPGEVEEELRRAPQVLDIAVVGAADDRLGEIPVAFVVLRGDVAADDATAAQLIAYSRDHLAHFKQIRGVEFIDALPRSEAGKVERGRLAQRAEAYSRNHQESTAP